MEEADVVLRVRGHGGNAVLTKLQITCFACCCLACHGTIQAVAISGDPMWAQGLKHCCSMALQDLLCFIEVCCRCEVHGNVLCTGWTSRQINWRVWRLHWCDICKRTCWSLQSRHGVFIPRRSRFFFFSLLIAWHCAGWPFAAGRLICLGFLAGPLLGFPFVLCEKWARLFW